MEGTNHGSMATAFGQDKCACGLLGATRLIRPGYGPHYILDHSIASGPQNQLSTFSMQTLTLLISRCGRSLRRRTAVPYAAEQILILFRHAPSSTVPKSRCLFLCWMQFLAPKTSLSLTKSLALEKSLF